MIQSSTYGKKAVRAALYTLLPLLCCLGFFLAQASTDRIAGSTDAAHHQDDTKKTHIKKSLASSQPIAMSLTPAEPRKLYIPRLGLSAPIESSGIDGRGEMAMPSGREKVGWFKQGYLPGALGNSVLAGHSKHASGPGAFHDIHTLVIGDEITVTTDTSVMTFTVTGQKVMHADTTELEEVFGADQKAKVNLVTCTGPWNSTIKRFRDRLIVFSEFSHEHIK